MGKVFSGIFAITLAILLIPFGFIWSINTLFPIAIPYSIETWLASIILLSFLTATSGVKHND